MRGIRSAVAATLLLAGCQGLITDRDKQQRIAQWNEVRAGVRLQLAEDQLANGRLKEAAVELASAMEMAPDDPRAALLSARLALAQGELEEAKRWLDRAELRAGDDAGLHFLRGVVHQAAGEPDAAVLDLATAMRLAPDDRELQMAYARALLGAGRPEDARDFLEGKNSGLAGHGEYHQLLGDVYLALDDVPRAVDLYEIASHFGPLPPHTREVRAFLLLELGRDEQAARAFEELTADESADPAPALVMGLSRALISTGRAREARRRLAVLLRTQQDDAGVWKLLAEATAACGDVPRAVSTAQRAVQLAPDDAGARQLLAALAARDGQWPVARAAAEAAIELAPQDELNGRLLRWVETRQGANVGDSPTTTEGPLPADTASGTESATQP